jgi:plastocyanin
VKLKRLLKSDVLISVISLTAFLIFVVTTSHEKPLESEPAITASVNGGTITGVISFPKEYPEREKIIITKDNQVCGAFQYSEVFVVSEENHGLQNVVVSLKNVKSGQKTSAEAVATLNQKGCRYTPHVQAVPVGATLEIFNSDGILHNVHAYLSGLDPSKTVFNKAQPKFLKKIKQTLDKPGMYYFKCDVHAHMGAFIAVMDHPYYSVSDESGKFTITNVPPGSYKVQAWHEALGTLEKEVTVESGKTVELNFEILPNE